MKTIYINGRFLTQPLSGMQRFAGELLSALDKKLSVDTNCLPNIKIVALTPSKPTIDYKWQKIEVRQMGRFTGHIWEQIDLAWSAKDGILLNLTSSGPLLHKNSVLALHDAAIFVHPEHFSTNYRLAHTFLRPKITRRARRLITISNFSKKELSKYCRVPESAFVIISDSAEHIKHEDSAPQILEKYQLHKGRYALTVGNQSPNKNISLAVRAFECAAPQGWTLAVVGSASDKIFGSSNLTDNSHVKRLGRVSDSELKTLYENAGLFLFPSKYEGFGVPPLEAMTMGCPVLSSRASAMPEILGDAAAYFVSNDLEDMSREIIRLTQDDALRKELVDRGYQRAKQFSWDEGANRLSKILSEMTDS